MRNVPVLVRNDLEQGSVRVNLSLPVELDRVLTELSQRTGRAKASYATEALTWYLPQLSSLLAELRALDRGLRPATVGRERSRGDGGEAPITACGREAFAAGEPRGVCAAPGTQAASSREGQGPLPLTGRAASDQGRDANRVHASNEGNGVQLSRQQRRQLEREAAKRKREQSR